MSIVLIKQKPLTKEEAMQGFESLGVSKLPDCTSTSDIPFIRGKYSLGLEESPTLQEEFENYYNVKFSTPAGLEFLDKFQISIPHDNLSLNTTNTHDKFILQILMANDGLGLVDMGEDEDWNGAPFIVEDLGRDLKSKMHTAETAAEAIKALQDMYTKNADKVIAYAKFIFDNTFGLHDKKIAFTKLFDYLTEHPKKHANCVKFLEVTQMDKSFIDATVTFKEAQEKGIVSYINGYLENYADRTKLGRNEAEAVKFLMNPENIDVIGTGGKGDKPTSLKSQLANRQFTGL